MQPRQRSKCSATVRLSCTVPSSAACISQMRPRGESISSLKTTYDGQLGRQKPQCTQSRRSSRSTGANERRLHARSRPTLYPLDEGATSRTGHRRDREVPEQRRQLRLVRRHESGRVDLRKPERLERRVAECPRVHAGQRHALDDRREHRRDLLALVDRQRPGPEVVLAQHHRRDRRLVRPGATRRRVPGSGRHRAPRPGVPPSGEVACSQPAQYRNASAPASHASTPSGSNAARTRSASGDQARSAGSATNAIPRRAARAGSPARRTASARRALLLPLGGLAPDRSVRALARARRHLSLDRGRAALEEHRDAARRQQVDGARRELRAEQLAPEAARVVGLGHDGRLGGGPRVQPQRHARDQPEPPARAARTSLPRS